jgi:hypothetical protein
MTTLMEALTQRLLATSVSPMRFRQLVGRLYAMGTLSRTWSDEECRLYDDAARIEEVLSDYFDLAGFRLVHDRDARVLRLYPPGSTHAEPGEAEEDVTKRLRMRPSRELSAVLLALRFLYAKGVQEGAVNEKDEVAVTVEELAQAMATTLGQALPRTVSERGALLRDARKLRVLRLPSDDKLNSPDAFVGVQRAILSLVPDAMLELILASQLGDAELEPVDDEAADTEEQA